METLWASIWVPEAWDMPSWKWRRHHHHQHFFQKIWKISGKKGPRERSPQAEFQGPEPSIRGVRAVLPSKNAKFGLENRYANRPKNKNISDFGWKRATVRGVHGRSFGPQNPVFAELRPFYCRKKCIFGPKNRYANRPKNNFGSYFHRKRVPVRETHSRSPGPQNPVSAELGPFHFSEI